MTLLLSFIVPLVIGYFFVRLFWPDQKTVQSHLWIKGYLAIGLGLGISSCTFFAWSIVFHPSSGGFIATETSILIGLTTIFLYSNKMRNHAIGSDFHSEPASKLKILWILFACFFIALTTAIIAFIFLSLKSPHGEWDAWAIWNMRARFIFRGGDHWTDAFSNILSWSHPDYPLLIPALVARSWTYMGYETVAVPILTSMLFTFATVGLLFSSLALLRSRSQACLAGIVLLGTPLFIEQGASQQADVPLGFFFLAATVLFHLQDSFFKSHDGLLFLAGMTAGFSAWTKNEGLLFMGLLPLSLFAVFALRRGWKFYLREVIPFAMGLMPILMIILYFKTQLVPVNDLLSSLRSRPGLSLLTDLSRYLQVEKEFAEDMLHFGNGIFSIPFLLALYLGLLGTKFEEKEKPRLIVSILTLCLMIAGYFFVYVTSPYNLEWHLKTSLNRLLMQLWPSLIFIFFLIVATPEQAMMVLENKDRLLNGRT